MIGRVVVVRAGVSHALEVCRSVRQRTEVGRLALREQVQVAEEAENLIVVAPATETSTSCAPAPERLTLFQENSRGLPRRRNVRCVSTTLRCNRLSSVRPLHHAYAIFHASASSDEGYKRRLMDADPNRRRTELEGTMTLAMAMVMVIVMVMLKTWSQGRGQG